MIKKLKQSNGGRIVFLTNGAIIIRHQNPPKYKPIPDSHILNKDELKWIIDLNVKCKNVKIFEENTGKNLCHLGLEEEFLNMTSKTQSI